MRHPGKSFRKYPLNRRVPAAAGLRVHEVVHAVHRVVHSRGRIFDRRTHSGVPDFNLVSEALHVGLRLPRLPLQTLYRVIKCSQITCPRKRFRARLVHRPVTAADRHFPHWLKTINEKIYQPEMRPLTHSQQTLQKSKIDTTVPNVGLFSGPEAPPGRAAVFRGGGELLAWPTRLVDR